MQATELLSRVNLTYGKHPSLSKGACVMECVAYVAGEAHTDHPACACPVITKVAIYVNDECKQLREQGLNLRILRLAGSNKSREVSMRRAYYLVDYAVRTVMPRRIQHFAPALADAFAALLPVDCPERLKPVHELLRALGGMYRGLCRKRLHLTRYVLDLLEKLEEKVLTEDACLALERITTQEPGTAMSALVDRLHKEGGALALHPADLQSQLEHEVLTEFVLVALDVLTIREDDTDMLGLLDRLLDIGDTDDIPVSPQVAQKIADLVAQRPAHA